MASAASCFFDILLVVLKLLEITCLLLKLTARTFLRSLTGRRDAEPVHIPSVASVTFNELCVTCQGIVDIISRPGWHKDLVHHESLASLENSSEQFCGICSETLGYIQKEFAGYSETLFPIKCESDTSSASWQSSFEWMLTSDGVNDFSLGFTFEIIEKRRSKPWLGACIDWMNYSLSNTGRYVAYKPASSTSSPESWNLIERWMDECTQNHVRCNATIPERWFPSRVLDVGIPDEDCVRLVHRNDIFSGQPYATLSHCWGSSDMPRAHRSNLQQLMTGIDSSYFTKTFLEAIRITRKLGLRYLWIDALCIIQDDQSDWINEASLMSLVYRYCFINIAATGSKNATGGCFWDRNPRAVLPTESNICWIGCKVDATKRYLIVCKPNVWAQKLTREPLNQRAWVLQERVLSPRVLHFGRRQLFWECRQFVACETYHQGLPNSVRGHTSIDIKRLQLGDETRDDRWPAKHISQIPPGSSPSRRLLNAIRATFAPVCIQQVTMHAAMKSASVFQDWDAIVELYTASEMTVESDKLPAVAGLASSMSVVEPGEPGDGYLAGLWQSSLPAYFLWKTTKNELSHTLPTRPGQMIAPTWSWASIRGKISLASCQHNYNSNDYLTVLQEAVVNNQYGYRFHRVYDGYVKLLGPLASVRWTVNHTPYSSLELKTGKITQIFPQQLGSYVPVSVTADSSSGSEIFFDTAVDGPPSLERPGCIDVISEDQVLTLLPIVGVKKRIAHESETVIGLVLIPAKHGTGEYERVGIFYTMRLQVRRILANMPQRSVTVI